MQKDAAEERSRRLKDELKTLKAKKESSPSPSVPTATTPRELTRMAQDDSSHSQPSPPTICNDDLLYADDVTLWAEQIFLNLPALQHLIERKLVTRYLDKAGGYVLEEAWDLLCSWMVSADTIGFAPQGKFPSDRKGSKDHSSGNA